MTNNPKYYIVQQDRVIDRRWTAAGAVKVAQLWARANHAACEVFGPTVSGTDLLAHISELGDID